MPQSSLRRSTTIVKNCKDLTVKLKANYLFPTSSSGANLWVAWRSRKEQNISTNQGGDFLDFNGFSWSYAGPKSNLHSRTEISLMALLAAKSSVILTINKYNSLTILMRSWLLNEKNKRKLYYLKILPKIKMKILRGKFILYNIVLVSSCCLWYENKFQKFQFLRFHLKIALRFRLKHPENKIDFF